MVTVTPNPALDRATSTAAVLAGPKMRCAAARIDPGGGGINVARVVRRLGATATVVTTLGGPTGLRLGALLEAEGLDVCPVAVAGETRDSLTVDDERTGEQYRFVLPGPALRPTEIEALLDAAAGAVAAGGWVVGSGSLPAGAPVTFWGELAARVGERGGRLILDTGGAPARAALGTGLAVLRSNHGEMAELVGQPLTDAAEQDAALGSLVAGGAAEVVVMGLGAQGSLVVDATGCRRIVSPALPKRSAVGAGDSLVGGLAAGLARGWSVTDAATLGVVAAAAAHATPGTELCRRDDVDALFAQATGRPLAI